MGLLHHSSLSSCWYSNWGPRISCWLDPRRAMCLGRKCHRTISCRSQLRPCVISWDDPWHRFGNSWTVCSFGTSRIWHLCCQPKRKTHFSNRLLHNRLLLFSVPIPSWWKIFPTEFYPSNCCRSSTDSRIEFGRQSHRPNKKGTPVQWAKWHQTVLWILIWILQWLGFPHTCPLPGWH